MSLSQQHRFELEFHFRNSVLGGWIRFSFPKSSEHVNFFVKEKRFLRGDFKGAPGRAQGGGGGFKQSEDCLAAYLSLSHGFSFQPMLAKFIAFTVDYSEAFVFFHSQLFGILKILKRWCFPENHLQTA